MNKSVLWGKYKGYVFLLRCTRYPWIQKALKLGHGGENETNFKVWSIK